MQKPVEKFCAFCGRPFENPGDIWPKTCSCGEITYRNPIPVNNVIVPVKDGSRTGVLLIQRGIEPCRLKWAMPGGYMELGETWQEGAARELWEETAIRTENSNDVMELFSVDVNPKRTQVLIFSIAPGYTMETLPEIPVNEEVLASRVVFEPEELAFPPHTEALKQFLLRAR